jgi:hypothetical protein
MCTVNNCHTAAHSTTGHGTDYVCCCFCCTTGRAKATASSIPAPCDKGTYSTGGTTEKPNAVCTACDGGYTTQEDESTSATECAVCKAGYGCAGCNLCGYGTFSSGGAKDGDDCQACPTGTTSKRGATQSQQCYSKYIDARNDVYNVENEAAWTAAADTVKTATACQAACTDSCVMYKFSGTDDSPDAKCYTYAEAGNSATVLVGFKIGNGDDYSVWGTTQKVGAALSTPTAADEPACKNACTASSECEVYNWEAAASGTGGTCTLTKTELEEASISMFQVAGSKLFSDRA